MPFYKITPGIDIDGKPTTFKIQLKSCPPLDNVTEIYEAKPYNKTARGWTLANYDIIIYDDYLEIDGKKFYFSELNITWRIIINHDSL